MMEKRKNLEALMKALMEDEKKIEQLNNTNTIEETFKLCKTWVPNLSEDDFKILEKDAQEIVDLQNEGRDISVLTTDDLERVSGGGGGNVIIAYLEGINAGDKIVNIHGPLLIPAFGFLIKKIVSVFQRPSPAGTTPNATDATGATNVTNATGATGATDVTSDFL